MNIGPLLIIGVLVALIIIFCWSNNQMMEGIECPSVSSMPCEQGYGYTCSRPGKCQTYGTTGMSSYRCACFEGTQCPSISDVPCDEGDYVCYDGSYSGSGTCQDTGIPRGDGKYNCKCKK